MVRKYQPVGVSRFIATNPVACATDVRAAIPPLPDVAGIPRKRRRSTIDLESGLPEKPKYKLYCPCANCAKFDKPVLRFLSVIEGHLRHVHISGRYKDLYEAQMLMVDPNWIPSADAENFQRFSSTDDELQDQAMDEDINMRYDEDFVLEEYMDLLRNVNEQHGVLHGVTEHCGGPDLSSLETEAATMIFDGATTSRLSIIFLLLGIQAEKKISSVAMDAIFLAIAEKVIPQHLNSRMPRSRAEARKIIGDLGLDYICYDSCPCDETLYYGPIKEDWTSCPNCNLSRNIDNQQSKSVPRKKMWFFPAIPRLLAYFRSPTLSPMMVWHRDNISQDGVMRIPADSPAWQDMVEKYAKMQDARSVMIQVGTDGFNPYGHNSASHSLWPITLSLLNLNPKLAIHKGHILLSTIVPGKKKVKNFNTYLEPLVDELLKLWVDGVPAYDANTKETFDLYGMMLWTVHDYPGYGVISSLQTQGYQACPCCGPDVLEAKKCEHLNKMIYMGHRKYLPMKHRFRASRNKNKFNGVSYATVPKPHRKTGKFWLKQWEKVSTEKTIQLKNSGMKLKSIFHRLPYYKHLKAPHLMDVMHTEKNICASLFKTFSNCKGTKSDSIALRRSMKDFNVMPKFHPKADGADENGVPKFTAERPNWIWTEEEFEGVISQISSIRTPFGYGSSFRNKFSNRKLVGWKTHDYHNLLHDLLPIVVRGTLTPEICKIVYRLSALFRWICSKEIKVEDIPQKKIEAAEILCEMEMHLPISVFDLQFHNVIHIVEEIELCGPVSVRWMYFLERYLKELKNFVRQRARPEGSIAEGYICAEALFHVNDYSIRIHKNAMRLRKPTQEDARSIGVVLPKNRTWKAMDEIFREQAHKFLLENAPSMHCWRQRYDLEFSTASSKPSFREWVLPTIQSDIAEKKKVSQMELDIAVGPQERAQFYTMCWGYGSHYRVMARDLNKKTTSDSGISAVYEVQGTKTEYFGYVDSIVRLTFDSFETVLFKCQFWDSVIRQRGPNATVLEDECGFDRVKTGCFLSDSSIDDDPFIFPKDVNQLFYVDDPIHVGWKLAVKVNPRSNLVVQKRAGGECQGPPVVSAAEIAPPTAEELGSTGSSNDRALCERRLVAVEADDNIGEAVDRGNDAGDPYFIHTENDSEEPFSDEEESAVRLPEDLLDFIPHCNQEEVADIESDGDMEDEGIQMSIPLPCRK